MQDDRNQVPSFDCAPFPNILPIELNISGIRVGLVNLNPIEQYNSTITQLQSRDNLYITCLNYKYE